MTANSENTGKKVFIKTWGCQMNVYDSTRMQDALEQDGYSATSVIEDADLVLLNTCHIRERAAEKVYSHLGRIRKLKEDRAGTDRPMTVGVTGCVAQAEGREIIARERSVDLVVGPQTYHQLPEILARSKTDGPQVATEYAVEDKFEHMPAAQKKQVQARGVTAFLTVQEGCDKFCTFCVVPYTRGMEVSRPRQQILDEARSLVDAGVREITLLGQNVNAWHGETPSGAAMGLGHLLHELAAVQGIERLRYVTSHPCDMSDDLIEAHRDLDVLMPYLHLPVQAGSDKILKAMNRKHTAAEYLDIIARVREVRPDIAISGDMIVGFPGETDEDFEATMEIVGRTNYAQCYSFKYSKRPGTPGAEMDGQVDEAVKTERLAQLQALLGEQQEAFNRSRIGKTMSVLLEKPGKHADQLIGRSPWLQSVIVPSSIGRIGDIVDVTITDAAPNSLTGESARQAA
ncbi:tRNA (N6-isopentenyl adenosine(37)-C2)-methylthiotransferase MiaB [Pseudahrensia aquimaris]|uniref:tRNA-2-methylthio-N(6)-dimethylallyladenosine synthase n=1 Tax=Pseudahrensia aquimaris TaxID=744461 RepID=A0ABW3FES0_9HYPH